ncbi:MAG TPA: accessory factor UbiK family protein [Alphaproteobacteria bacterium]|jgi:BMFP domain-containing protein YqiC
MKPDMKILDDIARVAGGAVNILSGMQQQIRDEIRVRMEEAASRMDLVTREDYDILAERVKKLEARVATLEKGGKASAPKKTTKKSKQK